MAITTFDGFIAAAKQYASIANDGDVHDLAKTGMPILFADSALMLAVAADSTSSGIPELEVVIANA